MEEYITSDSPRINEPRQLLYIFIPLWIVLLGVAGFFYINGKKAAQVQDISVETESVAVEIPLFLSLISRGSQVAAVGGEVLITGRTLPHIPVSAYSDIDQSTIESDGQGQFETSVLVSALGGSVRISVFGDDGEEKSEVLTYTPASKEIDVLGNADEPLLRITATPKSHDSVPSEFVSKATLKIRLPDEVTDNQAKNFLQNKLKLSHTQKIGLSKLKDVIAQEGSGSSKFALGKAIIKMNVAQATPGATLKRHAIAGVVTSISDGVITLSHQIQTDRVSTILYNTSTTMNLRGVTSASASDIQIGLRIIAVGLPSPDGLLAAHIHIFPARVK